MIEKNIKNEKESSYVDKSKTDKIVKIEKNKGYVPNWMKWIFGSVFLFGSSAGLLILLKNKNKFLL